MSKRMKVFVSVLVAIFLLAVVGTATVMAQEESTPLPEAGKKGLLVRVAEILDIPEEDVVNAFKQAQQEMREEAFMKALDRAVEKGRITEGEAKEIKGWWEQKPEALESKLLQRACIFKAIRGRQMMGAHRGWH